MLQAGPSETITLDGGALGITPAVIAPTSGPLAGKKAQKCLITVEDAGVTVLFDGTAATASNGHKFLATDIIPGIDSYQIAANFSAIKTSGNAKLKVTPFFEV